MAFRAYNSPSPPPRSLPVSSRLRNQSSPLNNSRYEELKRFAAMKTRSTTSRLRNSPNKRLNYSELTDDEDDEDDEDEEEEANDPPQSHKKSSQARVAGCTEDRQLGRERITAATHKPNGSSVATSAKKQIKLSFSRSITKSGLHSDKSANNPSSREVIVISDDSDDEQPVTIRSRAAHSNSIPVDSTSGRLFKNLATEVLQQIASYLPTDGDVYRYRHTCRSTFFSITASVWRQRFFQKYDPSHVSDTNDVAHKYLGRFIVMRTPTIFDVRMHGRYLGDKERASQPECQENMLKLLRGLILESNNHNVFNDKGMVAVQGKNLQIITEMISDPKSKSYVDIVDGIFCTPKDDNIIHFDYHSRTVHGNSRGALLYVVQLCLAPYYLGPARKYRQRHFDVSQYQTYNFQQPLFVGDNMEHANVRLLLHMINFFQFHLKAKDEGILASYYESLALDQVPRPWNGTIKGGVQPLGQHWKGIYTHLDPKSLARLRAWDGKEELFVTDHLEISEAFQDISFFFADEGQAPPRPWPKQWEDAFIPAQLENSRPGSAKKPTTKEIPKPEFKEFSGTSRRGSKEGKNGHFFGRIYSMEQQHKIPGFQRITIMKFDATDVDGVDTYDPNTIYAYEGCVFPGGNLIAGRWFNPRMKWNNPENFSGPFLWWNVEEPVTEMPIQPDEALEFLEVFWDQVLQLQ